MPDRRTTIATASYNLGFEEGWTACLARVQERGLTAVIATEARLCTPSQLRMPATANEDFDTCVYCKAPGCEDDTAEHAPDCPSLTGIYIVTLQEMWPGGPAQCEDCGTKLWPGDSFAHFELFPGGPLQVACIGCVGLRELGLSSTKGES